VSKRKQPEVAAAQPAAQQPSVTAQQQAQPPPQQPQAAPQPPAAPSQPQAQADAPAAAAPPPQPARAQALPKAKARVQSKGPLLVHQVKSVGLMRRVWEAYKGGATFTSIEGRRSFNLKGHNGMTAFRICRKYAGIAKLKFPAAGRARSKGKKGK